MTTESTEGARIRTFIWGSCVSRDTFKHLSPDFVLHRYVARQSLISAGNTVSGVAEKLSPIASQFQQRMVSGDLEGNLYSSLEAAASHIELLLVDLVDERGGVVEFNGTFATKLNEFWGAGGREASRGAGQLTFGSDAHFAQWSAGARRFVDELSARNLLSRTVVLRADWASTYEDGALMDLPEWMMTPVDANAAYGRYFDLLHHLGLRIVELPHDLARSTRDHEWGASPFHYQHAAYEYFAAEIESAVADNAGKHAPKLALQRRDIEAWGAFTEVQSTTEIETADLESGLLTLWHNGMPFDFLLDDIGAETTLVSFHAALGKSGLKPPVFTARTISDGIGVNRIFVSDPALLAGSDLGLAWYLGTSEVDATAVLTEAISALQRRMGGKHLAFFGMSGGGFAALNLSHEFPGSLAIPVNPQTRILDYAQEHWDELGRRCFGAHSTEESRLLLETHPRADLRSVYADGFRNSVIYVQNAADAHTVTQMIPWFEAIEWKSDNAAIFIGEWGKGHVPPPGPQLKQMLQEIAPAHGNWRRVASAWNATSNPTRATIKSLTGR